MLMRKGICCKFSQNLFKTDQHYFFEIIQRVGARGFGASNLKHYLNQLKEQAKRGTL